MEEIGLVSLQALRPEIPHFLLKYLQALVALSTLALGLLIQIRLLVLIRKKRNRGINDLIKAHQVRQENAGKTCE